MDTKRPAKRERVEVRAGAGAAATNWLVRLPSDLTTNAFNMLDATDLYALLHSHRGAEAFVKTVEHLYAVNVPRHVLKAVWELAADSLESIWIDRCIDAVGYWRDTIARGERLRSVTIHGIAEYFLTLLAESLAGNEKAPLTVLHLDCDHPAMTRADFVRFARVCTRRSEHWTTLVLDIPWKLEWPGDAPSPAQRAAWTADDGILFLKAIKPGAALRELHLPIPASDGVLAHLSGDSTPSLERVTLRGAVERELWTGAGVEHLIAARQATLVHLEIDGATSGIGNLQAQRDQFISFRWWREPGDERWSLHQFPGNGPFWKFRMSLSDAQLRQSAASMFDVRAAQWDNMRCFVDTPTRLLAWVDRARSLDLSAEDWELRVLDEQDDIEAWDPPTIRALLSDRMPEAVKGLNIGLTDAFRDTITWQRQPRPRLLFYETESSEIRQNWLAAVAVQVRVLEEDFEPWDHSDENYARRPTGLLHGDSAADELVACPKLERLVVGENDWWLGMDPTPRLAGSTAALERVLRESPALTSLSLGALAFPAAILRSIEDSKTPLRELTVAFDTNAYFPFAEIAKWPKLRVLRVASGTRLELMLMHGPLRELVAGLPELERLGVNVVGAVNLGIDIDGTSWLPASERLVELQLRLFIPAVFVRDLFATVAACPRLAEISLLLTPLPKARPPSDPGDTKRADRPPAKADVPPTFPTLEQLEAMVREFKLDAIANPPDVQVRLGRSQETFPSVVFTGKWTERRFLTHWLPYLQLSHVAEDEDPRERSRSRSPPRRERTSSRSRSRSPARSPSATSLQVTASKGPRAAATSASADKAVLTATSEARLEQRRVAREVADHVRRGDRVTLEGTTATASIDHGVVRVQPTTSAATAALRAFDGRRVANGSS